MRVDETSKTTTYAWMSVSPSISKVIKKKVHHSPLHIYVQRARTRTQRQRECVSLSVLLSRSLSVSYFKPQKSVYHLHVTCIHTPRIFTVSPTSLPSSQPLGRQIQHRLYFLLHACTCFRSSLESGPRRVIFYFIFSVLLHDHKPVFQRRPNKHFDNMMCSCVH